MIRAPLALPLLLTLVMGCRDGPTQLTLPLDTSSVNTGSAEFVMAVGDLLNDPLVHELVDGAGTPTDVLDDAVQHAYQDGTPARIVALSEALTVTRDRLALNKHLDEENADALILRAALILMLDDAMSLLEDGPTPGEDAATLKSRNAEGRGPNDERR